MAVTDEQELAEYQSVALASGRGDVELIEHGGKTFEVRLPTLEETEANEKRAIEQKVTVKKTARGPEKLTTEVLNKYKMGILQIISATFIPGTDKRVFNRSHEAVLMTHRPGDLGPKVALALNRLQSPKDDPDLSLEEDVAESFGKAPISSSSTK